MDTSRHLLSAAELAAELEAPSAPRVLDVRWTLQQPHGHPAYLEGHVPGALYVDLDTELAGSDHSDPLAGRHPLPSPEEFQATVRRWGVEADTPVVVYDDNAGLGAARAWWLLRWAGLENVRLLDGGLGAWQKAGLPLSRLEPEVTESGFVISPGSLPVLDAEAAQATAAQGILLDARAPERFRGETEPLDLKAGHIPGARSAPATENVTDGVFRPLPELRERFRALGVPVPDTPGTAGSEAADGSGNATADAAGNAIENAAGHLVGSSCGSGVTACHNAFVLDMLGVPTAIYPPSWSGWSADPERPVETGDPHTP